jgi:hypothetical protein
LFNKAKEKKQKKIILRMKEREKKKVSLLVIVYFLCLKKAVNIYKLETHIIIICNTHSLTQK